MSGGAALRGDNDTHTQGRVLGLQAERTTLLSRIRD